MSEFIGTKLTMNLGERSYDIIVKSGSLENLYQFARLDRRVAVVTDSGVPAQYAQMVADQCKDAHIITVPQGEASKSFKILESVLKQMLEFGMGRGDLVIAVGGGVVGDLAGFAASIYMRGIDFINCPTTTLSMIDSSIGGKTAVDLGDTKNIVGAFWQPKLVIVDPDTLSTLPRRHFINGLAEAVKASLLADPELFAIFENGDVDARSARSSAAACGSRRTSWSRTRLSRACARRSTSATLSATASRPSRASRAAAPWAFTTASAWRWACCP
mgnify:FL=1